MKRLPEVPGRRAQKVGGGGDGSARTSRAGPRRQNRNRNPRACPRWSQGPSPPAPPPALRALPRVPLRTRRAALRAEQPPSSPPLFGGRASGPGRDLPLLAGAAAYQSVGEEPSCHCGRSAGASEGWGAARGTETGTLSARRPVPGGGRRGAAQGPGPGTWGGASRSRDGARRGGVCGHERPAAPDRAGTRGPGPADSGTGGDARPRADPTTAPEGSGIPSRDFPLTKFSSSCFAEDHS